MCEVVRSFSEAMESMIVDFSSYFDFNKQKFCIFTTF